jgi:hypothetical protein
MEYGMGKTKEGTKAIAFTIRNNAVKVAFIHWMVITDLSLETL